MTDVYDIDWNLFWNDPRMFNSGNKAECSNRWSDRELCRNFDAAAKRDNYRSSMSRIEGMRLTKDSRVLDIGAGPGSVAIPLSQRVSHVTAVEPSEGMRECLLENIAERSVSNITVVPKTWQDVDVEKDLNAPYDVVFASYSLGVPDLREALLKMNDATEKYVYIFWFADMISHWKKFYRPVWKELFGVPPVEKRTPNVIYNLLHQLGFYANIEVTKSVNSTPYASIDDAVKDQAQGLLLTEDSQFAVLKDFLTGIMRREDGRYYLDNVSYQSKIWWEKDF